MNTIAERLSVSYTHLARNLSPDLSRCTVRGEIPGVTAYALLPETVRIPLHVTCLLYTSQLYGYEEIFPDLFSCHIDGKTFAVCIAFLFATISGEA